MPISERYFDDTNFLFKLLRMFNLMEPGRAVVSLSKSFFILMMFILGWTAIMHPDHIVALITAATGTAMALLNYMKRRSDNHEMGIGVEEVIPSGFIRDDSPSETDEEPVID